MWVLDQVNGRLMHFDEHGAAVGSLPMDRENAQDLALAEDGSMAVLDRYGEADVALYDPEGNLVGSLPLAGEGLETPGHATGVFIDGDEVYAENGHGPLVHIGNLGGAPSSTRDTVPGRPTRDGKAWIKAGITDADAGRLYVIANRRPGGEHLYTRELVMHGPTRTIVLLDSDKRGTIYLGAEVEEDAPPDPESEEQTDHSVIVIVCLDGATGEPTGTATALVNTMPEETFRDFTVLDDGGVVYAYRTDQGGTYEQIDCE